MSEDIRQMIDKVKNFKEFVNENVNINNIISFDLAKKLKDKKFHIPTDLFYTDKGIISNEFYKLEYEKGKVPRADWNAYPENPNAKPWYRYGYSAPQLNTVIKWIKERFNLDVNDEFEISKALENI